MSTTSPPQTVAILGLGAMGSRVARRILDAGHRVRVWNRSPEATEPLSQAGADVATSPRQAAGNADVVLSLLTDDAAARDVWLGPDGAVVALSPDALAIEMSTVTPQWVRQLAAEVESAGARCIESPVVGSRPQAEAGQLICLAGGQRRDVDSARSVLDAISSRVVFLGELGLGAVAKLAVNTFFATQLAAAGELLHFLRRGGIEDERWLDLFANLPIVAPPVVGAMQGMVAGRFAPLFPMALVEKDLRYFLQAADQYGAQHPLAGAVQSLFAEAIDKGLGDQNIHGICQVLAPREG